MNARTPPLRKPPRSQADLLHPILLKTFVVVAESGSFTKAAERLKVTQPAVSQRVGRLEAATQRTLVVRRTPKLRLTEHGSAMLSFARTILAAQDEATEHFKITKERDQ